MGEVLHYRDFRKPAERWSNTERRNLAEALCGLVENSTPDEINAVRSAFMADTGPCETIPFGGYIFDPGPYVPPAYLAPENDSA